MDLIAKPKSHFLKVKCKECDNEMIIFDHAKMKIQCSNKECDQIIAEPQSGKAIISGEILEQLE